MAGRLQQIAERVASLSRNEAEELYALIKDCAHTANQNGVFVNLAQLPPAALDGIEHFLKFSEEKKYELDTYDRMRESLRVATFPASSASVPLRPALFTLETVGHRPSAAVSAMRRESLKFQLLKKRYTKPQDPEGYANPVLEVEPYE